MECSIRTFIKLNTNGSSLGNPRLTGAGRLLRNSSSAWVSGFSLHMGFTSNNISILLSWEQFSRVSFRFLAWNLVFKFIHLKIDSMTVLS